MPVHLGSMDRAVRDHQSAKNKGKIRPATVYAIQRAV